MTITDGYCINGHDVSHPNSLYTKNVRRKKVGADGIARVYSYTEFECKRCQAEYSTRYKDRKKAGLVNTVKQEIVFKEPVPETLLERLRHMKKQGERELKKAREEGWIK